MDPESSKLLNITTAFGNFCLKVLGQGLCSSQDLFNYLTRGTTLTDTDFQIVKNVDDFLIWAATLEELDVPKNDFEALTCQVQNLRLSEVRGHHNQQPKVEGWPCHLHGSSRQAHGGSH